MTHGIMDPWGDVMYIDLVLLKQSLKRLGFIMFAFALLFWPEAVVGSIVSLMDCGIVVGVWYLEWLMIRGVFRFIKRGLGFGQNNRVSSMIRG